MQAGGAKIRTRKLSVTIKKTSQTDTKPKSIAVKRSLKDSKLKRRSVRFRSTDEEYVFEVDPIDKDLIPGGSDIFQAILKDMIDSSEHVDAATDTDNVFKCISKGCSEIQTDSTKMSAPRKSILKRRTSYRK